MKARIVGLVSRLTEELGRHKLSVVPLTDAVRIEGAVRTFYDKQIIGHAATKISREEYGGIPIQFHITKIE